MAITLDELLGRNTTTEKSTEIFPSYEEFSSVRNSNVRTAERKDSYGASNGGYGYYSAPQQYSAPERDYAPTRDYAPAPERDYASARPRYNEDVYTPDYTQSNTRQQSFYDYVARNNTQIDDVDLYNRLSRTNDAMNPVFGSNDAAQRNNVRTAQNVGSQQKTRGRLNTKGKLILGSFLAVVVTVMSLIIAFASKINNGTAVVPASNAAAVQASVVEVL